ncbi:hypothetical protein KAI04_03080 [Candidatus Pacearchaeota archaeon]|nr:hypothetical protein [Candidatus Pacearchaeota archaeon]
MTPEARVGVLEILLDGKIRTLKFQEKKNGQWEYTRGKITITKKYKPEIIAGLLVKSYKKKGINIPYHEIIYTNHTQHDSETKVSDFIYQG